MSLRTENVLNIWGMAATSSQPNPNDVVRKFSSESEDYTEKSKSRKQGLTLKRKQVNFTKNSKLNADDFHQKPIEEDQVSFLNQFEGFLDYKSFLKPKTDRVY